VTLVPKQAFAALRQPALNSAALLTPANQFRGILPTICAMSHTLNKLSRKLRGLGDAGPQALKTSRR